MDRGRVVRLARGELPAGEMTPGERAAEEFVRKTVLAPARLAPGDLLPLVEVYGLPGAMEVAVTACSFHFINRIAELVGLRSDLPVIRRTQGLSWKVAVRVQTFFMRLVMDLRNRSCETADVERVMDDVGHARGWPLPPGYRQLQASPGLVPWLATCRDSLRQIDGRMLEQVRRGVEASLPASAPEARGFHRRPHDPLAQLVFVGTRYAARTTDEMIATLKSSYGYDDGSLTDLFYAIAMMNCFTRLDRLLAVPLHHTDDEVSVTLSTDPPPASARADISRV